MELVYYLCDAGTLHFGESLDRQRQAPIGCELECSAIAAVTRRLPSNATNNSHRGARRSDFAIASVARPSCEARVIVRARPGQVPPITEYQASHPAFRPVAANSSPETPIVTCLGTTARSVFTSSRTLLGSVRTPGILIDAIPGSSATRV